MTNDIILKDVKKAAVKVVSAGWHVADPRRDAAAFYEKSRCRLRWKPGSSQDVFVPQLRACLDFRDYFGWTGAAWGCAGHRIVALIAKQHLSAKALEAPVELLEAQPIDPRLA